MQQEPADQAQAYHLPQQFTSFVGRANELAQLGRSLADPFCRLVTLAGPGGMGKTRLAIQATAEFAHLFPGGSYFVNLQPVQSEEHLVSAIADALNVPLSGQGTPLELVHTHLTGQQILLTLDNFEQLSEASPVLSTLLEGTAVKFLITSRATLNLHEECIFPLEGMPFPKGGEEDFQIYDAVQLFVERARRVRPDFSFAQEAENVAAICRLVQGMPLAIELAAPWIKTLDCGEILAEIEHSRDLLVTRLRNVPERHRSMQAIFSQTLEALTAEERQVFRRLSVFRGGFLREAAAAVAGATLPLLTLLLDKSLLHWEADERGTGRYQIHELLRQFAAEKLQEHAGETTQVMALHGRTYAQFVDQRGDDLLGGRQQGAMVEIEAELNNIRAAWQWAIEQKEMEALLQIGQPFVTFYWYQSRFQEAVKTYTSAVECLEKMPAARERDLALAAMLTNLGWFELVMGNADYGEELAQRSLEIYLAYDAPPPPGLDTDPRLIFGLIHRFGENIEDSIRYLEQVLAETERRPHLTNETTAHRLLTQTYEYIDQWEPALEHALIAYELGKQLGDKWGTAYTLFSLGGINLAQGEYETAEQYLQACYDLQLEMDFAQGTADVSRQLADLALRRKDAERARQHAQEAVRIYQRSQTLNVELEAQVRLAHALLMAGEYESTRLKILEILDKGIARARHYHEMMLYTTTVAADLHLQTGELSPGIDWLIFVLPQRYSRGIPGQYAQELFVQWQGVLEPEQLAEMEGHAAQQTLEMVLTAVRMEFITPLVLSQPEEAAPEVDTAVAVNQTLPEPLTNRELEVLGLIAGGLTNHQIAEQLFISTGTVKYYSSHIYGKLQVNNRTQAVAVAREIGLINN